MGQVEELLGGVGGGEGTLGLDDLSELAIVCLDAVGGVDELADLGGEVEEGGQVVPVDEPGADGGGVSLAPDLLEATELTLGLVAGRGAIDGPSLRPALLGRLHKVADALWKAIVVPLSSSSLAGR